LSKSSDFLRPDLTETRSQRHLNSYVHAIVSLLKLVDRPLTAAEIRDKIRVDILGSEELLEALTNNERIECLNNDVFAYKPLYRVRSKDDLLELLREKYRFGVGVEIADLREFYANVDESVQELIDSRQILCIKNKDGSQMSLYFNIVRLESVVDEEFRELWQNIQVPDDIDLQRELDKAGLKTMEVHDNRLPITHLKPKKKAAPKRFNRRVKITNTHLENIDFSKDMEVATIK